METFYDLLLFLHVISFVFMSVPLFNLIVVNERAGLGIPFNYQVDRYMENIIKNGAGRCFVFQATVASTGILLLILGPLGIEALWTNWMVLAKTIITFTLVTMLSNVHLNIQPGIEKIFAELGPEVTITDEQMAVLKPLRVKRKKMATFCLFLVMTTIILGLQVYEFFTPILTGLLVVFAGLFAFRAGKTLIRFGWM